MKKQATLTVAMLGIFSALILLMTFTPIGYLVIPGIGVSATLIHIPVIVGAVVLGPKLGTALGLVWGVTCVVRAAVMPQSVLDPLFVNPLVSILPRILVGLFAGLVFVGLKKLMKEKKGSTVLPAAIAGGVGALTNTIFVLGILFAIYSKHEAVAGMLTGTNSVAAIIGTILSVNGAVEIFSAVLLTPPIAKALLTVKKRMAR